MDHNFTNTVSRGEAEHLLCVEFQEQIRQQKIKSSTEICLKGICSLLSCLPLTLSWEEGVRNLDCYLT